MVYRKECLWIRFWRSNYDDYDDNDNDDKEKQRRRRRGRRWLDFVHPCVCVCVLELHVISIETLCSNCLIWLFLEQCDVRISVPYSLIKPKGFYNPTNERIKSIASNYLLTWKYSKNWSSQTVYLQFFSWLRKYHDPVIKGGCVCVERFYTGGGRHNPRYILIRETAQATQTFGPFSNPQTQMDRMCFFFFSLLFFPQHIMSTQNMNIYIYI